MGLWIMDMLEKPLPEKELKCIYLDLPRTNANYALFSGTYSKGQKALFAILKCIAISYPEIGYV